MTEVKAAMAISRPSWASSSRLSGPSGATISTNSPVRKRGLAITRIMRSPLPDRVRIGVVHDSGPPCRRSTR